MSINYQIWFTWSPSSRRAWIEIRPRKPRRSLTPVALLAEGVDRNLQALAGISIDAPSPSSRRAWIEIEQKNHRHDRPCVALLAEGVDRNMRPQQEEIVTFGRPPRGGRG